MIIYLHGFNSSGNNEKVTALNRYLKTPVFAPSYPSNDIDNAITIVGDLIETNRKEDEPLMVIGSSMGGFIANYIGRKYNAKIVLINPALDIPSILSNYLGENTNFKTGETYNLTVEHIVKFETYKTADPYNELGTLVLLNKGDEVIDYQEAANFFNGAADVRIFVNGDHRFKNMDAALPLIEDYLKAIWL